MALSVISRAEEDGRLSPGGTVVEYTGGSTGASLALVCAAKGYRIHVVSSKAFSQEKLDHMVSYGAQLTLVPTDAGGFTKQLFLDMIEAARQLALTPNTFWVNQIHFRSEKKYGRRPMERLTRLCTRLGLGPLSEVWRLS